jgi:hypothetical protein
LLAHTNNKIQISPEQLVLLNGTNFQRGLFSQITATKIINVKNIFLLIAILAGALLIN